MPPQLCAHRPCSMVGRFCSPMWATLFTILLLQCTSSSSESHPEAETLLKFKESLQVLPGRKVGISNWNNQTPPCNGDIANWNGLLCHDTVWGLKLENMGLFGTIDVDLLLDLDDLRTISFMNNTFNGTLPKLNKLVNLKSVYFSGNKFSGEIDADAFEGMNNLKKIHLASNELLGSIPSSMAALPKLIELHLERNNFTGEIPDFKGPIKEINVSNNQLHGPIPKSLSKMKLSSFSGNGDLCGAPLQESCGSPSPPPPPETPSAPPSPSSSSSGMQVGTIIGIVAGVIVLIVIVVVIFMKRRKKPETTEEESVQTLPSRGKKAVPNNLDSVEKGSSPRTPSTGGSTRGGENSTGGGSSTKLTFLREDAEKFELGDLLKASAEVLGSGYLGSSYKATLQSGKMIVVKRFRHMNNLGREEFHEHMRRIGRLSHPNLLPIVAFYYRKEEKLIVGDYTKNLNLAVHLHGNSSRGQPSPDWPTRLKIVKGVAKGLQYLYTELPSIMLPHGHLKSSNVLLTPSLKPLLTDYALVPVVNLEHAQDVMVAYKSPEYKHSSRVTKKTDVWSFGILILEILTGQFPSNLLQQGKGGETDLANWVESILNQGNWSSSDLFAKEMGEVAKGSEGQMMKLLKIGLACAENDVEKRLGMKEAIVKIEEVKEKDDDEFYSFDIAEGDITEVEK